MMTTMLATSQNGTLWRRSRAASRSIGACSAK